MKKAHLAKANCATSLIYLFRGLASKLHTEEAKGAEDIRGLEGRWPAGDQRG